MKVLYGEFTRLMWDVGCGQCFNLTLLSAVFATPPFVLAEADRPWIVVKITVSFYSELYLEKP